MDEINIRECTTIDELDACVRLQRIVFGLPDLEISPRRHLIVSRQAGGWTLGAFVGERLVGFVHHLAAVRNGDDIFGYSHMMAVDTAFQNKGVGARLKWSQRARAISEGRKFIKWTWDPMQARNAHFNLNRLGVTVSQYAANFYGTDYPNEPTVGIDSDRLFAEWRLTSDRVSKMAQNSSLTPPRSGPVTTIPVPVNWTKMLSDAHETARVEQRRVRQAFQDGFAAGLICAGFDRSGDRPAYLLYQPEDVPEL